LNNNLIRVIYFIYIPDNNLYLQEYLDINKHIDKIELFLTIQSYQIDRLYEIMFTPREYAYYNIKNYFYSDDEAIESRMAAIRKISTSQFKTILTDFFSIPPIRIISESNKQIV